jgi:hypothetical protein
MPPFVYSLMSAQIYTAAVEASAQTIQSSSWDTVSDHERRKASNIVTCECEAIHAQSQRHALRLQFVIAQGPAHTTIL